MNGIEIKLKHQVSILRYRDLLAAAERQRLAAMAIPTRPGKRPIGIAEVRTAIAAVLLRGSSWLMPEVAPDGRAYPG